MVERSLSMREVPGSIPGASKTFLVSVDFCHRLKKSASSRNRTRAARVAGEHSTTEPTMLDSGTTTYFSGLRCRNANMKGQNVCRSR